jgi:hypothetical protein
MLGLRRGPRTYKVFISHRYDDDEIYSALRRHLIDAKNFAYKNLSVEVDKQLDTASTSATKRSLSSKIKKADVFVVFAHSASEMVDYELDRAKHYNVPVISIVDPMRAEEKYRRARSRRVTEEAKCEVRLDQPDAIIAAIRKFVRPQNGAANLRVDVPVSSLPDPSQTIVSPRDIAQRLSEPQRRAGFVSRLGAFLFRRSESRIRPDRDI